MKRTILLAVCLCLALPLFPVAHAQEAPKPRVVTTIFPPYDFVRAVAGDLAEVTMLLPPGAESHSFEPTPQDILTIQNCDVFVYVGGATDAWAERILDSMDTENIRLLPMLRLVDAVEEEIVEGMEEEHEPQGAEDGGEEHGGADEEPELDEHVWTSPRNAKTIVAALAQTLSELDPDHAAAYAINAEAYLRELDALDAAFQAVVDGGSRRTIVFGDRFPFRYLADAYGLTYYAAFPGCATETEASAATIAFLIDKVRAEGIPVVFTIEFSNGRIADAICESTGAAKRAMHSAHNLSRDDFQAGVTYLDLMRANAALLEEALRP